MRRVTLSLLGTLFLFSMAQAATYRWTGDDGQVMYSQIPPADGRAYTVIGPPPPPADAASDKAKVNTLRQSQADRTEDQELTEEAQAKAAEKAALVARNCEVARQNIASLQGSPHRLIRLPDGTVRRLLPEERDAKVKTAQDYIDENCP